MSVKCRVVSYTLPTLISHVAVLKRAYSCSPFRTFPSNISDAEATLLYGRWRSSFFKCKLETWVQRQSDSYLMGLDDGGVLVKPERLGDRETLLFAHTTDHTASVREGALRGIPPETSVAENYVRLRRFSSSLQRSGLIASGLHSDDVYLTSSGAIIIIDCNLFPSWFGGFMPEGNKKLEGVKGLFWDGGTKVEVRHCGKFIIKGARPLEFFFC